MSRGGSSDRYRTDYVHIDVSDDFSSFGKLTTLLIYVIVWISSIIILCRTSSSHGRNSYKQKYHTLITFIGAILMIFWRNVILLQTTSNGPIYDLHRSILLEPLIVYFSCMILNYENNNNNRNNRSNGFGIEQQQTQVQQQQLQDERLMLSSSPISTMLLRLWKVFFMNIVWIQTNNIVEDAMSMMSSSRLMLLLINWCYKMAAILGSGFTITGSLSNILIWTLAYDDITYKQLCYDLLLPIIFTMLLLSFIVVIAVSTYGFSTSSRAGGGGTSSTQTQTTCPCFNGWNISIQISKADFNDNDDCEEVSFDDAATATTTFSSSLSLSSQQQPLGYEQVNNKDDDLLELLQQEQQQALPEVFNKQKVEEVDDSTLDYDDEPATAIALDDETLTATATTNTITITTDQKPKTDNSKILLALGIVSTLCLLLGCDILMVLMLISAVYVVIVTIQQWKNERDEVGKQREVEEGIERHDEKGIIVTTYDSSSNTSNININHDNANYHNNNTILSSLDYTQLIYLISQFILVGSLNDTGLPQSFFTYIMGHAAEQMTSSIPNLIRFMISIGLLTILTSPVSTVLILASTFPYASPYDWIQISWIVTMASNLSAFNDYGRPVDTTTTRQQRNRTSNNNDHQQQEHQMITMLGCIGSKMINLLFIFVMCSIGCVLISYHHVSYECSVRLGECY